ncbi:GNAT family N-acetyltransferase [Streptomyces sp. NBC_00237]|uniref:GNAT family N-acetyltransferase n=1 Tax=Streptomyces sp. NBC_00237 TaxID=2975687 RepID=UPI0022565506|nr:GNAT family N-acetyltransferase [Streptomyces sp. NBC_00237]MCX5206443.1 GNAT family N-acetyltransferase [Streptomyces sp. NBC_00237]
MPSTPQLPLLGPFLVAFARRQAVRTVDVPGGFAVYDDAFAQSRANNHVIVDSTLETGDAVDPEKLPALADKVLGHLPHRMINVLDDATGVACTEPLRRAGYGRSTYVFMVHTGPVPTAAGATAVEVGLDELRAPLDRQWRSALPDVDDEVIRQLVERRETRRRGADTVRFLADHTPAGEVASWADLYLDPVSGIAQIEDLNTSPDHLRRGHADAVLATALRMAEDAGCGLRFLTADATDWPQHWYARRGFSAVGRFHCFERG